MAEIVPKTGNRKATDKQIADLYASTGSCKKAAAALGMCHQSVHERLQRLGLSTPVRHFTEDERSTLIAKYQDHADRGHLADLAQAMGRTRHFICRQAKALGLTKASRSKPYMLGVAAERMKDWHSKNPHPKGALGMKHSAETKATIGTKSKDWHANLPADRRTDITRRTQKTRAANGVLVQQRPHATWKAGWREVGDRRVFFRSKWEANYARHLECLKAAGAISEWEHEPGPFWFDEVKKGAMSYLPDFRVTAIDGSVAYHEVKGWMDDRSVKKLALMAHSYPSVVMVVVDATAYHALRKMVASNIAGWEE